MRKKFVFNKNKKKKLGNDAYLVKTGLRYKRVIPIIRGKKSPEEVEALKQAKKQHNGSHKMVTILKTHCNG